MAKSMGVPDSAGDSLQGARTATGQSKPKDVKLFQAAQEFESYFVSTILKQMRQAIPSEGLLHSRGEEMFQDMMDDHLGEDIAKGQGFGLADALYRQLTLDAGRPGTDK